jgi:hypothetical protein
MERMRIIVGGFLGILPAGGVTWDYVQYPLGFSLLGHDVYYIEDTRLYPIYQKAGSNWNDCSSCVNHLREVMNYFGLNERWAYRDEASGKIFGLSEERIKEVCKTADAFVNISCSTFLRDEYLNIPARILIDSDPMFTQIQYLSQQMFTPGSPGIRQMVDGHNYLFTFGENIGFADCRIPDCGLKWLATRQPICLDYWRVSKTADLSDSFTTLMNWTAAKTLQYDGEEWGQKDMEFKKYIDLPYLVKGIQLSAIVNQTGGTNQTFSKENVTEKGWQILEADTNASDWKAYQQFINSSLGEFSVAKETYVKANTGWFSCRSACYLAAGKPVITQDTGWSKFISSGKGVLSFTTIEEAVFALDDVVANPLMHAKAARLIAEEYFDSKKVLQSLLNKIN